MSHLFFFLFGIFFSTNAFPGERLSENNGNGVLEITVSYVRQSGHGSNQYAVWIEDSVGKLVKTLYVTQFTAKGGYVRRPAQAGAGGFGVGVF
ncbi:MAG: DUF2271 domain-containing protein [Bacteroidales bacterium]|nr:DUF2271 domain-containing protein [Bacteroidales bacterium]